MLSRLIVSPAAGVDGFIRNKIEVFIGLSNTRHAQMRESQTHHSGHGSNARIQDSSRMVYCCRLLVLALIVAEQDTTRFRTACRFEIREGRSLVETDVALSETKAPGASYALHMILTISFCLDLKCIGTDRVQRRPHVECQLQLGQMVYIASFRALGRAGNDIPKSLDEHFTIPGIPNLCFLDPQA